MAHLTNNPYINSTNALSYLSALAYDLYGKRDSNVTIDVLVVGGSALAIKHNFRSTVDIDADVRFAGRLTESVNIIADKFNIPTDWINQEFTKSTSYHRNLWCDAVYVCSFYEYFNIYVVSDLSQLCMKAVAGRDKDLIDIKFLIDLLSLSGVTYTDFCIHYSNTFGKSVKVSDKVLRVIKNKFNKALKSRTIT